MASTGTYDEVMKACSGIAGAMQNWAITISTDQGRPAKFQI